MPPIKGSSPELAGAAAPERLALLKFSVVFAKDTLPLVPRTNPPEVVEPPLLNVAAPAMTRLLVIVRAPDEMRLSVEPALSCTEAVPSESATVPTSSTPASILIVPESEALEAVRMRLPPPCLMKPAVPASVEPIVVLFAEVSPRTPESATMTGVAFVPSSVIVLPEPSE